MMVRRARKLLVSIAAVLGAYVTLLVFPEPFFPVAIVHASVTFRGTARFDSVGIARITDAALARISESELYDPATHHRVFVMGDRGRWAFFNGPYQRAIARNCDIGNAIFVPQLDTGHDRIVHFDGRSADAVGILAHEMMHTLMERRVGLRYWWLPWWKREGYAEYIGSLRATQLESPAAYRDAALAWKHLLEDRRMTFDQVIASTMTLEDARRR